MREIIFRGKRLNDGEWIEGNFVKGCIEDFAYIVEFGNKDLCRNYVEVIPETVGQYTGFDDKNGKKVFEGDILKAEIWWEQGGCYPHTETRFIEATFPNMYKNHFEKFEVVGNIYDNPELLRR